MTAAVGRPPVPERIVGITRPKGLRCHRGGARVDRVAALIRSDAFRGHVERYRMLPAAVQKEAKWGAFWSVIWSGPWKGGLQGSPPAPFSGLWGFDVDKGTEEAGVDGVLEVLRADPSVALAGVSVGGAGCWCVVVGPERAQARQFRWWRDRILAVAPWGAWSDPSAAGVMRRRFIPHDPDAYWNPGARPVVVDGEPPAASGSGPGSASAPPRAGIPGSIGAAGGAGVAVRGWRCTKEELAAGLRSGEWDAEFRGVGSDGGWWSALVAAVRCVQEGCIGNQDAWEVFDEWSRESGGYDRRDNMKQRMQVPGGKPGQVTHRTMKRAVRIAKEIGLFPVPGSEPEEGSGS